MGNYAYAKRPPTICNPRVCLIRARRQARVRSRASPSARLDRSSADQALGAKRPVASARLPRSGGAPKALDGDGAIGPASEMALAKPIATAPAPSARIKSGDGRDEGGRSAPCRRLAAFAALSASCAALSRASMMALAKPIATASAWAPGSIPGSSPGTGVTEEGQSESC